VTLPEVGAQDALQNGVAALQAGRLAEAEAAFGQAVGLEPRASQAHHLLGVVVHQQGRGTEAAGHIRAAIALDGAQPSYHCNLGVVLESIGRFAEAESSLRAAIGLRPEYPGALSNLGQVLNQLGRPAEAEACLREALRQSPDLPNALNNLAIALSDQGRPAEAEQCLRQALRLAPGAPNALNNLGIALFDQGRREEAEASFREALSLQPDLADARNSLASMLLLDGRFKEGWEHYEWRWKTRELAPTARGFTAPMWRGEPISGRTLMIYAEQGFGDTLQFCRYASMIEPGATVVLEVQPPLAGLLASLPGSPRIVARGEPLPAFDLHCPLHSLPRLFGANLDTIPAAVPYLAADPARVAAWRGRLADLSGLRVGLVWAGDSRADRPRLSAVDARRSTTLKALAPLADVSDVAFVSLQKGPPSAQAAHPPVGMSLTDVTAELSDFADTAALIENLDLVISVDTSVAHLAGALGKPVWLLNRYDTCWRWLLDRDDSPWYPTLRQFRQPSPGDWLSAIYSVREALSALAAGER
jgi:Flp pilus assembly protein TadD